MLMSEVFYQRRQNINLEPKRTGDEGGFNFLIQPVKLQVE